LNCYTSPFTILPYISLHSVHSSIGSDNDMMNFTSSNWLRLVHIGQRWMKGNTAIGREREYVSIDIPTIHLTFPWPLYIVSFPYFYCLNNHDSMNIYLLNPGKIVCVAKETALQ
jgi:hypothetical protein